MSAGGGSRAGSRPPSSREIGSDTRSTGRPSSSEFKSDSARSSTRSGPRQQTALRSEQIAFGRKLGESDLESESDLDAGVFLSDWSESEAIPPGSFQAPRNGFTSPISNVPLSYSLVQPVNRLSPDDKGATFSRRNFHVLNVPLLTYHSIFQYSITDLVNRYYSIESLISLLCL